MSKKQFFINRVPTAKRRFAKFDTFPLENVVTETSLPKKVQQCNSSVAFVAISSNSSLERITDNFGTRTNHYTFASWCVWRGVFVRRLWPAVSRSVAPAVPHYFVIIVPSARNVAGSCDTILYNAGDEYTLLSELEKKRDDRRINQRGWYKRKTNGCARTSDVLLQERCNHSQRASNRSKPCNTTNSRRNRTRRGHLGQTFCILLRCISCQVVTIGINLLKCYQTLNDFHLIKHQSILEAQKFITYHIPLHSYLKRSTQNDPNANVFK